MTSKRWIITASDKHPITEIRRNLETHGLCIDSALEEIGVFVVKGSAAAAKRAKKVAGVIDISPEDVVDVGPPGSGNTW